MRSRKKSVKRQVLKVIDGIMLTLFFLAMSTVESSYIVSMATMLICLFYAYLRNGGFNS